MASSSSYFLDLLPTPAGTGYLEDRSQSAHDRKKTKLHECGPFRGKN